MEFIYLALGIIIGAVLIYFILKSATVSRNDFETLNGEFIKTKTDYDNLNQKNKELQDLSGQLNEDLDNERKLFRQIKDENTSSNTEIKFLSDKVTDLQEDNRLHKEKIQEYSTEKEELIRTQSDLDANNLHLKKQLDTQKEEIEKLQEMAKTEFQNLANKILEEKSEKFTLQNQQNIKTLLGPLQEKISEFEKKVENTHKESIDYHAALRQQIIGLKELNLQMGKEAVNLTKALKGDNKMQGNWGELILENVLEKSGLERGREFEIQKNHNTEDGRLQPDVVINLPDGKKMIIDSKVSLNAYERWVNEDDETLKNRHLQEHLSSLKKHIEQLSEKNYQKLYQIDSPDFVLLFVPIEPAFALAINSDNQLYNKAFEMNIILVTPSTLLATLKTIDSMWTNKKQQENTIEIARQAGALYDKFDGFVNDLIKLGKKMDDAKSDYEAAMNKLVNGKGNLVNSTQKLKLMGAKAKKSLPESIIARANFEEEIEDIQEEN